MGDRPARLLVSRGGGYVAVAMALVLGFVACAPLVASRREAVYSLPKYGVDRFVRARGYSIHYVEAGEGQPVLLIPGAFTTYRAWNRMLPQLAVACKVLAVDYVGVGDSDKPESGFGYSVEEQAGVLAEMIRRLGLSKVDLVGASYGGAVALNLAARYPELVGRVVSIEGGAIVTPDLLHYSRLGGLLGWPVLGDIIWGFMQTGLFDEPTARSIMGTAWDGLAPAEREEIVGIVRTNIRTATKASWLGIYRAITGRIDLTTALERTPVRALYLYGERSRYRTVSERNVRWFERHMPDVEIIPFPGGIHDLHLQFPRAVAAAILEFLETQPGDGILAKRAVRRNGLSGKALGSVVDESMAGRFLRESYGAYGE